ncbi:hypothetical protein [Sulfitobacter sp. R18_1]|uniref:hypothetical protein n=1 Tax=Sulfitobacter sp. R18_1 TaxID=2821104 RepID=UPI001ADAE897|nr:hypothetical protein [Sulfitobacter sp. R18_1]MBO9429548.1 hypothetical protein [Sulfitobacter sp. R18_1]
MFKGIGEVAPPTSVQTENSKVVRALVLGGMGGGAVFRLMVVADLAAGQPVELFSRQLVTASLDITALYLTRISSLRRLSVFLDWLSEVLPDEA